MTTSAHIWLHCDYLDCDRMESADFEGFDRVLMVLADDDGLLPWDGGAHVLQLWGLPEWRDEYTERMPQMIAPDDAEMRRIRDDDDAERERQYNADRDQEAWDDEHDRQRDIAYWWNDEA